MKKILVPLTGRPLDRRAVAAAFLVAERFAAHVEGLSVMPQVEIRSSVESAAIPKALAEQLIRIGQAEQDAVVEGAHRLFDEFCARHGGRRIDAVADPAGAPGTGLSASWRQATGPLADTVAEEARLADLAVIAQASDGTNAMGPVIEAALFGSGRPLLLAPLPEPASLGTAVAVAWDGGSAAARAVAMALPLLHRAGKVVILSTESADPGRADAGRVADPERLARYLALHGVAAVQHRMTVSGQPVSRALLDNARDLGCDLLVMGAYGHSRVRERVWGGVTLDMLREPSALPILMAH